MKRVVITGMGIYSCIGKNLDEVKDSLYHGKSGIGIDPVRKELLDRRKRLCLPEQGEYAYLATLEAFRNAGIDEDFLETNEVGILYGNDSSAAPVINAVDIIREKKNTALVGSGSIFQSMNSTVTMNLSVIFKLRGVNFTIAGACASGSHAIGMGYLLIKSGLQDCILCGGAQEVNPYAVGSFDGLSAFSTQEAAPEKASKPFDKRRDGLIPSGGAASLVLESYESAVKRGAPILAEVIGYGFSSNGDHISVPNVDGPKRSLQMAIKDAGIALEQINYINAHATSTPVGDLNEAKAIADAQAARGGSIETGTFVQRIKAMVSIIIPVFAGAIRHADNLSLALDARCYEEGIARTHWRVMSIAKRDIAAGGVVVAYVAALVLIAGLN